jgi:hypothetical protein
VKEGALFTDHAGSSRHRPIFDRTVKSSRGATRREPFTRPCSLPGPGERALIAVTRRLVTLRDGGGRWLERKGWGPGNPFAALGLSIVAGVLIGAWIALMVWLGGAL